MFWFPNRVLDLPIKRVFNKFKLINGTRRDFCKSEVMAKSKFEYVKDFETKCVIMPNCWIVVRIEKRGVSESLQNFQRTQEGNDQDLMSFAALKVMKSFREIALTFGNRDESSFVFQKKSEIYNRRAAKIASSVNSLFTAFYVSQWPNWFPETPLVTAPCFCSSTFIHPSDDCLKSYLSWRQSDFDATNSKVEHHLDINLSNQKIEKRGTSFLRKNVKFPECTKERPYVVPFYLDFIQNSVWREHPEVFTCEKGPGLELNRSVVDSLLFKDGKYRKAEKFNDLEAYHFWKEYHWRVPRELPDLEKMSLSASRIENDQIDQLEFEVEDLVPLNEWIVVRIDGKGFHKFSKKHDFEKPNDENALNVMNFAAVKVMEAFDDIVLSYGQSDEYTFVFHKSTNAFERRASEIESCVNSIFTANYIMHWKSWNPDKPLQALPTFDSRTVPYPSDSVLKDYLSWRQADVHINNLYNTCFWKLVLEQGMKNSDAEGYLRLEGNFSADKRKLLQTKFQIEYEELPVMFRKGTTLLRKRFEDIEIIYPFYTDMIGETFWKDNPEILDNGPWQSVDSSEGDLPALCSYQIRRDNIGTSREGEALRWITKEDSPRKIQRHPGIRGLLCKDIEFEIKHSFLPNCWIALKIKGTEFEEFSEQHNFQKPNDENALNLLSYSAIKLFKDYKDIILAYVHSDSLIFVLHNTSKLYRRPVAELTSTINEIYSKYLVDCWPLFFSKELHEPPSFNTMAESYPSIEDLKDYLNQEQREAHEKNLHNTVLWKLIMEGGRTLKEAENELQNASKADKNELLFQEFGINYNNMPVRHKKGTILLRKNVNVGNDVKEVVAPYFTDMIQDAFWKENYEVISKESPQFYEDKRSDNHFLLKMQIEKLADGT